jgi:hypothetical protein
MNLPGFYAQSSLRKASGKYYCLAHHGAGSRTSVALPQSYRASGCDLLCGNDADGDQTCVVDCGGGADPGVHFGPGPGPTRSPKGKCINSCTHRYPVGSKRTTCIADCP